VTAPRIPPGGRREVGVRTWLFSRIAGRVTGTTPPNLFLTLGRHPKLFHGWLRFAGRLMPRGTLPRRDTELVILRVAHLASCEYEWHHHVRLGRRAGFTDADISRIAEGPHADGWSERQAVLLEAVDALHRDRDLDGATWESLRRQLDERETIEFLLLVGHYEMLATTINTLGIETDRRR